MKFLLNIFLFKSPLRLLTYQLSSNDITLCFICSQRPEVDAVEQDVCLLININDLINLYNFLFNKDYQNLASSL